MSIQFEKLTSLLKELFQTDQAELDFGMYRVINQRRDEINHFLEEGLLPLVRDAFSKHQSFDARKLKDDLNKVIQQADDLGVDPESSRKVKEIREKLDEYSVDIGELENEVYSSLFNFFRRYYDKGDFISQRRYKEGVYAIPYEGEEVKLHWANYDQYYIKTSEYLRNYSFKLLSGKKVNFKLIEADTEKDNRKEIDDKERRFILAEKPLLFKDGEVSVLFEFRPDEKKRNQNKINEQAIEKIIGLRKVIDDQEIKDTLAELATLSPTENNKDRTLLAKHLEDYTRRNTQDYFIHKDLRKFLRRELDFFIKNEIMHLDNVENQNVPRVEHYLSKIKVFRQIAHKLIDFLAQIEDFQKKLWLKKKFVVETNYCITLDRIPKDLYKEIIENDRQRAEWVKLFAINEIKKVSNTIPYSKPLTIEFLNANPFLVLDTRFFNQEFKYKLLSRIENLDNEINGLLVHSENFQALKLFEERYSQSINCIYIDPPYNAKSSEILYKNTFKHSSWLSLMSNRIFLGKHLLCDDFVHVTAIDEVEQEVLGQILTQEFPKSKKVCLSIVHNPRGQQGKNISYTHEFAYLVYPDDTKKYIQDVEREEVDSRNLRDSGTESNRNDAATCFYPIFVKDRKIIGIGKVPTDDFHPNSSNIKRGDGVLEIWPLDDKGNEKKWRYSVNSVETILEKLEAKKGRNLIQIIYNQDMGTVKSLWVGAKYDASEYGTKVLQSILGAESSSMFSYPKSIHTVIDCLQAGDLGQEEQIILDYFAGSGTTGHAVINLNRADNRRRKYILVEMGQYFDTVLKPRIQRVIYSEDWENGKPVTRKGSNHIFKYIKLESYEDTLNNLELKRTVEQNKTLFDSDSFQEDYLINYMLDFESKSSLLDLEIFTNPFDYKLKIANSIVGETVPNKVDLIETFNYLIGLRVHTIKKVNGVVLVEGRTRKNKSVLVIWRNTKELDSEGLNAFFTEHFAERQKEFDSIYVNGDNNLQNIFPQGATWNVHLTEEEFHYRMFEE